MVVLLYYALTLGGEAFARPGHRLRSKCNHTSDYACFEAPDPGFWVPRGYAVLHANTRGMWNSEGHATWLSLQDAEDYFDLIEWAAAQPWSTGRVGLSGVSYLAMSQWSVAALNPPHLAAIMPWEGVSDMYREMAFHGGMRETGFLPAFYRQRVRSNRNPAFALGVDTGILDVPRVRLEVRPSYYEQSIRGEPTWPVPGTTTRRFYLDAGRGLLIDDPAGEEASVTYTASGRSRDQYRAAFVARFNRDTELTGGMRLHLWIATEDSEDADLFAGVNRRSLGRL